MHRTANPRLALTGLFVIAAGIVFWRAVSAGPGAIASAPGGSPPVLAPASSPGRAEGTGVPGVSASGLNGLGRAVTTERRKLQPHEGGALVADSPKGFRGFFDSGGVRVVPGGSEPGDRRSVTWQWRYQWRSIGRFAGEQSDCGSAAGTGAQLSSGSAALGPQIAGKYGEGARFDHGGIIETWYNLDEGLEQTIDIPSRPPGGGRVVLDGTHESSLGAQVRGEQIEWRDGQRAVLTLRDLIVRDATDRELDSSLAVCPGRIRITYDDHDATYPVVIDPLLTTPGWTSTGDDRAYANFGMCVATAGDVNGDGYSDVIVGAPSFDTANTRAGKAYLYLGSASGTSSVAVWTSTGDDQAFEFYGYSVATAGDVNGDGYSDVIVGSYGTDTAALNAGKAFLYLGSPSGLEPSPAWTSSGDDQAGAYFGHSVATAGDVNRDGYSDVIIGADEHDTANDGAGKAYVFLGSASGLATSPVWSSSGDDRVSARYGSAVSPAGDVNGDGYFDIMVAAEAFSTSNSEAGKAYVYLGTSSGPATTPVWASAGDDETGARYGTAVAAAGDVNGDGYSDIIVGSLWLEGMSPTGKAFVYLGSALGPASIPVWTSSGDGQASAYFGFRVAGAGDVNGDGYADMIVGANAFDTGFQDAGKVYLYLGSKLGPLATPAWSSSGDDQLWAQLGWSVAGAGDVDGDGFSDVILGAAGYDTVNENAGKAYVFSGAASGLSADPTWTASGENQDYAQFGFSVASAGDINADGYADVIVGASRYSTTNNTAGKAYLYPGAATGVSAIASWTSSGEDQADAEFGASVAGAGDVNGDGYSDVIVGARSFSTASPRAGRVYLFEGSSSGLSTDPSWVCSGDDQGDAGFGQLAAAAGDVNGDGYSDVIISAPGFVTASGNAGKAYVYLGSSSGLDVAPIWTSSGDDVSGAKYGTGLSSAGDVNGDGYSDILVGAFTYDFNETDEGKAYLYLGSPSGPASAPVWTSSGDIQKNAYYGWSLATAGDVNGDGYADIVVGANGFATLTSVGAGKAYLYLGSTSGPGLIPAWTSSGDDAVGAQFGYSVGTAGDVNGDGYSDLIIGSMFFTTTNNAAGKAYLYLGSASGPASSPAWASSGDDEANAFYGCSAATAGDANGDGYSDIIVGAYSSGTAGIGSGRAFLYQGNDGGGLPLIPRQMRADNSAAVQLLNTTGFDAVRLHLWGRLPAGRTRARLVYEIAPLGAPFDMTNLGYGPWVDTNLDGVEMDELVSGLSARVGYHWRARLQYFPLMSYDRWVSWGPNGALETDLLAGETPLCVPTGLPDTNCDNVDDDCANGPDDGYPADPSCFLAGVCAAGNVASSCAGGIETPCATGSPSGVSEALCNGVDDDCDSTADEDYQPDTSCFLPGACAAGDVGSSCAGGVETPCATGSPSGVSEALCNGLDDDCDGAFDEDAGLGSTCAEIGPCEVGVCNPVTLACEVGVVSGCCRADADCAAVGACVRGFCDAGSCAYTSTAGCCARDADCDDGRDCTVDGCDQASGTCSAVVITGCCVTNADCDDGDPCTYDECVLARRCQYRQRCDTGPCAGNFICAFGYADLASPGGYPGDLVVKGREPAVVLRFAARIGGVGGQLRRIRLDVRTSDDPAVTHRFRAHLWRDRDNDGEVSAGDAWLGSAGLGEAGEIDEIGLDLPAASESSFLVQVRRSEVAAGGSVLPFGTVLLLSLIVWVGAFLAPGRSFRRARLAHACLLLLVVAAMAGAHACTRVGFSGVASARISILANRDVDIVPVNGFGVVVRGAPITGVEFVIIE